MWPILNTLFEKNAKEKEEENNMSELVVDDITSFNRHKVAPDWHFIRLTYYGYRNLRELKEWLADYTYGRYKTIGIGEHCPYEVGVLFEDEIDAMAYKLTWYDGDDDDEDF